MRKLILDTETTGLDYDKDRIIECACLELINGQDTEERFHSYYNPDGVLISQQSEQIHGLSNGFLMKYKSFEDSIDSFLEFFDVGENGIIWLNHLAEAPLASLLFTGIQIYKFRPPPV